MSTRLLALFSLPALLALGCSADSSMGSGASGGDSYGGSPASGAGVPAATGAGTLTAGEWRDNEDWPAWELLLEDGARGVLDGWRIAAERRISVQLVDGEGPAVDVEARLVDGAGRTVWTARSGAQGQVQLFAPRDAQGPFEVALWNGQNASVEVGGRLRMAVRDGAPQNLLDVMFMIDTTGSMCDELRYIQVELDDVIRRATSEVNGLRVRTSVGVYRDHGDEYTVRSFPFRNSASEAATDLARQGCGGGGDYPEAADEALLDGIRNHRWSERARGRLLFLVLDAPPHQRSDVLERLALVLELATTRGIRVVPVASSGIDQPTEYLLRALAVLTGGTYVFLTDDSGVGNAHLDPTVGDFDVEPFNELLVRLLREAAGAAERTPGPASAVRTDSRR